MQTHILIVDDEDEARNLLKNALRNEPYDLSFAANGAKGVELARQTLPDIIITDLMMPVMNGLELCRQIRSDSLLSTVPILMLTSMTDRESRLKGIAAGADDFLAKPCDRTELRTRLRTITRLNRYRRLINEQRKFQWVIEQAREAYVLLNNQGEIEFTNACAREFLQLSGDDSNDIAKVNFLAHVQQSYQCQPENLWENWPPSVDQKEPVYLVRPETRQSRALWLDVRAFHSPDSNDGVLVLLRDVSNQVSMQRRACTFESLISHKLLSPLGTMSILPMLKKKLHGQINDELMEFLDLAIDGANRLQTQVKSIITYIETIDSVGLIHEEQHATVKQVLLLLKAESEKQQIQLEMKVDKRLLAIELNLSENDFQTLLSNLLSNSKKFHPQQTPTVVFSIKALDDKLLGFSLSDDGVHLPVEELDKVWQPYYQNEKNFTGEINGMGLGLSRVSAIVWSAGGHCHLSNREDKPGVTIDFSVPITVTDQKASLV